MTDIVDDQTFRAKATIRNSAGIHCRPTAVIVKEVRRFDSTVTIHAADGNAINPTSAIELLALGLEKGAAVEIEAVGQDAQSCGTRMVELFETEFDFPPRDKGDQQSPGDNLMA